jgi:hypothetical protein
MSADSRSHSRLADSAPRYGNHVTRAAWPDPLFMPDLALVLGLPSVRAARDFVLDRGIPHLRVGGRLAVRRQALLSWLDSQETPGSRR